MSIPGGPDPWAQPGTRAPWGALAPIFAMLAGLSGALAVVGAELFTSLSPKRGVSRGITPMAPGGEPQGAPS